MAGAGPGPGRNVWSGAVGGWGDVFGTMQGLCKRRLDCPCASSDYCFSTSECTRTAPLITGLSCPPWVGNSGRPNWGKLKGKGAWVITQKPGLLGGGHFSGDCPIHSLRPPSSTLADIHHGQ